jgi:hypothetical protein
MKKRMDTKKELLKRIEGMREAIAELQAWQEEQESVAKVLRGGCQDIGWLNIALRAKE